MPTITRRRMLGALACATLLLPGCAGEEKPQYGREVPLMIPGTVRQTWAVAPVIDLSGNQIDPILQADLVFNQLQQVDGVNAIPVNRVVEIYQSLRLAQVESEEQAAIVCDLLGVDGLLVTTITLYDPYDPPKLGASMALLRRGGYRRAMDVDPRELVRRAAPPPSATPNQPRFVQSVGMFDASNGSTRDAVLRYAAGRADPESPLKSRIYFLEMDRYCSFVYHSLLGQMLQKAM